MFRKPSGFYAKELVKLRTAIRCVRPGIGRHRKLHHHDAAPTYTAWSDDLTSWRYPSYPTGGSSQTYFCFFHLKSPPKDIVSGQSMTRKHLESRFYSWTGHRQIVHPLYRWITREENIFKKKVFVIPGVVNTLFFNRLCDITFRIDPVTDWHVNIKLFLSITK